ncbi:hypothetical protein OFM39_34785, partial [Escherichia coli]|nr:hypothetical protein [Escherichia coli]
SLISAKKTSFAIEAQTRLSLQRHHVFPDSSIALLVLLLLFASPNFLLLFPLPLTLFLASCFVHGVHGPELVTG